MALVMHQYTVLYLALESVLNGWADGPTSLGPSKLISLRQDIYNTTLSVLYILELMSLGLKMFCEILLWKGKEISLYISPTGWCNDSVYEGAGR